MNADDVAAFLPEFWRDARRDASPLEATLQAMAGMLHPVVRRLNTVDAVFDPRRCPDAMLPFLAHMLGFAPLLPLLRDPELLDAATLRALLMIAPRLARDRGTRGGLARALRAAVGTGARLDESVPDRAFHVRIHLPVAARARADLVDALARLLAPAHVTHDVAWTEEPPADDPSHGTRSDDPHPDDAHPDDAPTDDVTDLPAIPHPPDPP
jgi:phage tail-like protein